VTGQFLVGIVDGVDSDQNPDAIPASGTVTFTASVPYLPDPTGAPDPATILTTSVVAVLDSAGYLCTPQRGTLTPAYRGVKLIATDDPDLSVTGWTWNAVYKFTAVNGTAVTIPTHSLAVPSDGTIDLTTAVKVPSSNGIGIEQAEALAASAQSAAVAAAASAADASQVTDAGVSTLLSDTGSASRAVVTGVVTSATSGKLDTTTAAATYLKTTNLDSAAAAKVLTSGTSLNNAVKVSVNAAAAGKLAAAEKGAAGGVAPLGADSKVPDTNLPDRLLATTLEAAAATKLNVAEKGAANGVAALGADSKVPTAQLPPLADKAKLDAATSSSAPSTLVYRDANGAIQVGTPTINAHATRKDYVDAGLYTKAAKADINVKDYGAVGNGVAVDAVPVQAALEAAAQGGVLRFPAGTYYMGTGSLTATLSGPLSIQGNGVVTLIWDSGNGLKLTQNNALHTVTIDGVSLFTRAAGSGVALEIVGTGQNAGQANLQPRTRNRGSIARLNIGGATNTGTDGWAKGIRLADIMNFYVTKTHIDGYAGPTSGAYVSTHGIEMVTTTTDANAVDVMLSELFVYAVQYAIDVKGYEGVLVDQSNFISVGTGFRCDAVDAGTPLVTFTNGQIAFINKGVEFIKVNQGVISDSLIYIHPISGGNASSVGVSLVDTTTTRITGCTFVSNATPMLTGVSITGASILNAVEACTFYSTVTTPVSLSASTSKNKVHNLILGNSDAQFVSNSGATGANQIESEKVPAQLQYAPAGAKGQTMDRRTFSSASLSALTSGTMLLTAVWVPAGSVLTSATYISGGAAAAGFTNRWFALYDENRNLIRTTADHTAAWGAGATLTLPFATSYTVGRDRLLYVGICEVATTPTTLRGLAVTSNAIGIAPILNGTSSTGLTNAASTPTTGAALTVNGNMPYAYLS